MSAALALLVLLPLAGALTAGATARAALPVAVAGLALALILDACMLLATGSAAATVLSTPWVTPLNLSLGLRFDRLSGVAALLIEIAGLAGLWRLRRAALVALFTGLAQAIVLAGNALLLAALVELGVVAAFALEAGPAEEGGGARIALYLRTAAALALLAAVLLIEDAAGSFEFPAVLAATEAIRAHSLYGLLLALVFAAAWSGPAAWPWIRRPAPGAERASPAAELTGVVFLVTFAYLVIRLWPLLRGALPRPLVVLGFLAVPLLVALIGRGARALGDPDGTASPAPSGADGRAHE